MLREKSVKNVNQQSPSKKETALHYACKSNQLDIIKFLVEEGVDVNLRGESLFATVKIQTHYKMWQVVWGCSWSILAHKKPFDEVMY